MNEDPMHNGFPPRGLSPWAEIAAVLQSYSDLNRTFVEILTQAQTEVATNQPGTEREILRWHATLLKAGLNLVESRIENLDAAATQQSPPEPAAEPRDASTDGNIPIQ